MHFETVTSRGVSIRHCHLHPAHPWAMIPHVATETCPHVAWQCSNQQIPSTKYHANLLALNVALLQGVFCIIMVP